MNDLERFLAVVHFEKPDYVPIFGFSGAPGMSLGVMRTVYERLVATGMPPEAGGVYENYVAKGMDAWMRYWGTTTALYPDFSPAWGAKGFKTTKRIEGDFEVIESESGALVRQVLDNDNVYSMPEFIRYDVRDRKSWEFFRERLTPTQSMSPNDFEANCKRYNVRTRPLCVYAGSTYGSIRGMFGPAAASLAFYDSPELVHEIMDWRLERFRAEVAPTIERLRPEIVCMGEDLCYNHGMLVSPRQFHEFFGPFYKEICETSRTAGVSLVAVDTDGNMMEYVGIAESYGVNGVFPCEVKAGNDLFALRRQHPKFVFFGWLEKEAVNEGKEELAEEEILSKVPPLLEKGGYFPNGDHGIQPDVTFRGMCKFMTLLHEVTGNPEGEFPRVQRLSADYTDSAD